jgi:hypothetical protein
MKLRVLATFLAGAAVATSVMAQSETGLPGVWQLNKEKSKVQSATAWAKVELTGETFSVILRTFEASGKEEADDWKFSLGSGESLNKMHGATMKSHVARDGDTVVVRSVTMFGSDALKTVDRWFVSDAGKTLTFEEKHQFAAEPEGMSLFVFERRPESAWPAPAVPKLAEESFKNIQILKGVPAERLTAVMASFATSLGVSCKSCHVDGDFASDEKPAKQTARKMWNMAAAINHDSFGGSGVVTCWTCHRGSVKPESQPSAK